MKKKILTKRGFTLLLATLLASLMAALGAAMFSIAQKELRLSSLGRDSQFAFYAADAGAECALYWDYAYDVFNPADSYANDGTNGHNTVADANGTPIVKCNTQSAALSGVALGGKGTAGGLDLLSFDLTVPRPDTSIKKMCVKVEIRKHATYPRTTIESRGYNKSCAFLDALALDPNKNAGILLERAVRIQY